MYQLSLSNLSTFLGIISMLDISMIIFVAAQSDQVKTGATR